MILDCMQHHERRAALLRIVGDDLIDFGFEARWGVERHGNCRFSSPSAKSQFPGSKSQRNSKHQAPIATTDSCRSSLKLGHWKFFGVWSLGFGAFQRSHSPMTKSSEPKMLTTSLIRLFGRSQGRMLRFTNDGARILRRCGVPPPLL